MTERQPHPCPGPNARALWEPLGESRRDSEHATLCELFCKGSSFCFPWSFVATSALPGSILVWFPFLKSPIPHWKEIYTFRSLKGREDIYLLVTPDPSQRFLYTEQNETSLVFHALLLNYTHCFLLQPRSFQYRSVHTHAVPFHRSELPKCPVHFPLNFNLRYTLLWGMLSDPPPRTSNRVDPHLK